ncbi:nucleoside/nucleotide kinase family protein [Herbaspirillum sp. LeCh32-8]|uniref:nucleoside/nucleotide kinase family protein n=1 Tax=Herbaspirillum sp. LeCh32-8 TaxID=2821356 RepID=UPI001AEB7BE4|nr:nucleoside/nucleotide kinase family protein [Herbaspirillum sp. LeCh32-8]MBP0598817.1 nucleoside/nucleotide kinase family protein [Herbaspirillum sp. LeCh32-8]
MISTVYRNRLDGLLAGGTRKLLGIAGPPGSGKSTLAQGLLEHAGARACIVPMDGFHLANAELARLGRAARKGAEDTFDSAGYVCLLERLRRQQGDEVIYAPAFHRDIEEAIAGEIAVAPHTQLVITEGNYLLLQRGHWSRVQPLLDEVWYVDVAPVLRRQRLVARHVRHGRTPAQAEAWVHGSDEPNAELIASTRSRAQLIFRWD